MAQPGFDGMGNPAQMGGWQGEATPSWDRCDFRVLSHLFKGVFKGDPTVGERFRDRFFGRRRARPAVRRDG
jgi:hypothetical protein